MTHEGETLNVERRKKSEVMRREERGVRRE
jgi:hypothetical protein